MWGHLWMKLPRLLFDMDSALSNAKDSIIEEKALSKKRALDSVGDTATATKRLALVIGPRPIVKPKNYEEFVQMIVRMKSRLVNGDLSQRWSLPMLASNGGTVLPLLLWSTSI